jgi:hypothetical protein
MFNKPFLRNSFLLRDNVEKYVEMSKNTYISNFMKIRPMEAELFHEDARTDGRTDMTKLTVAFRKFENASKNLY